MSNSECRKKSHNFAQIITVRTPSANYIGTKENKSGFIISKRNFNTKFNINFKVNFKISILIIEFNLRSK